MNQRESLEEQVSDFLADKEREVGSEDTMAFYRATVQNIFLPWAQRRGIENAGAVTVEDWNAYVDWLRSRPRKLSIHSVRTYLRGPKVFLRSLEVAHLEKFKQPKAPKTMLEILTREQIDRLEELADTERDKLIVRVLANTGIRVSELTGLKLKDLHEITSPKRYYRIRVWGKGSKEREVPIDWPTFKRLKRFARSGEKRISIFALTSNAVAGIFRDLKEATGITEPCTPHKLRHAFATYSLQNGMAIEKLQRILGHADLSMIVKVYAHLTPDDSSREYERVFGGAERVEEPKKRRRIA